MFLSVLSKLIRFLSFHNERSVLTINMFGGKKKTLCSFSGAFPLALGSGRVCICPAMLWGPRSLHEVPR